MKNSLETRLGLFFALAFITAVILFEMIGGLDFFKRGFYVRAQFNNVQELKKGDAVKMAGVEVGRVDLISRRAVERSHNWIRRKEILESARVIHEAR